MTSNNSNINFSQYSHDSLYRSNLNINQNQYDSNSIRKIAQFNLRLIHKDYEHKIGKINDDYNPNICIIEKESSSSKTYKLTQRKTNSNELMKFTGNLMAEQTSKYLIFKTSPEMKSNIVDVLPAENWFIFKKDINYKTINLEDAEEKMKIKSHVVDSLKNKGPSNNITSKSKKDTKERKNSDENNFNNRKVKKAFDEDEEDENKYFKKNQKEPLEEFDEKEATDLELKEIPSDMEEDFFGKKEDNKKVNLFESNQDESSDNSDDSLFEKSKENSEVEDDLSEIDRKFALDTNAYGGGK